MTILSDPDPTPGVGQIRLKIGGCMANFAMPTLLELELCTYMCTRTSFIGHAATNLKSNLANRGWNQGQPRLESGSLRSVMKIKETTVGGSYHSCVCGEGLARISN